MVQCQSAPEPRTAFGGRSLRHVTKSPIEIEDALFHVVANRWVDDNPRSGRKAGRINSFEIQFGETGRASIGRGNGNRKDVVAGVSVQGELFAVDHRAARIELLEGGRVLGRFG